MVLVKFTICIHIYIYINIILIIIKIAEFLTQGESCVVVFVTIAILTLILFVII